MRILKLLLLLIILFIGLFSIIFFDKNNIQAGGQTSGSSSVQLQDDHSSLIKPSYPVICQLKTQDKIILVSSGSDCLLYSLKSDKGNFLALDLTAEKLSARYPELKDLIKNGIANWAGLDVRYNSGFDRNF